MRSKWWVLHVCTGKARKDQRSENDVVFEGSEEVKQWLCFHQTVVLQTQVSSSAQWRWKCKRCNAPINIWRPPYKEVTLLVLLMILVIVLIVAAIS